MRAAHILEIEKLAAGLAGKQFHRGILKGRAEGF